MLVMGEIIGDLKRKGPAGVPFAARTLRARGPLRG